MNHPFPLDCSQGTGTTKNDWMHFMQALSIPLPLLDQLERNPADPVRGKLGDAGYTAEIAIPDYEKRINEHYATSTDKRVKELAGFFEIPFDFTHFGLIVRFDRPTELTVHDAELTLDDGLRELVRRFGPVIIKNAYSASESRNTVQKNIFQNLRFHYDRGRNMENQYSLYTRNPFDEAQKKPRDTSTLFLANIVAHMQCMKEEGCKSPDEKGIRPNYDIFLNDDMKTVLDDIILNQPWSEPEGTGEMAVIDNLTVLHSSWHRVGSDKKSYPIGTRYLF